MPVGKYLRDSLEDELIFGGLHLSTTADECKYDLQIYDSITVSRSFQIFKMQKCFFETFFVIFDTKTETLQKQLNAA